MELQFCHWDVARFFFFSDNVFDPLIYYSHLGPIIVALVSGFFVFLSNRKDIPNRVFILLMGVFSLWSAIDLVVWATSDIPLEMFLWSTMIFLDLAIYILSYYFVFSFIHQKDVSFFRKILLAALFSPLFVFVFTIHNLGYFDFTNCDRVASEGGLWLYVYIVEIFLTLWILFEGFLYGLKVHGEERWKIFSVTAGVVLFLLLFSWGNLFGSFTEDWSVGQYGLFGLPIFIAFLAYAVVKYQALNIRTFGVQVLVLSMIVLVGTQLFYVQVYLNKILTIITLLIITFFGYLLIRSTREEIRRKEELQEITERLAEANHRLKELDKAKSDFISIASHQLRTPLTSIKGFISLVIEGGYGAVSEDVKEALKKVYLSNERIIQLVEDLLNISRIESGKIQYRIEPCDIERIVLDTVEMFRFRAKEKGIEFLVAPLQESIPKILTDGQKIREVLSNIIDNAIKYSEKGTVRVAVEKVGGQVRISVRDEGIGINPSDIPFLFQKFSRGKDIGRLHVGGTGLGLYVGKNFVEALGGRITLDSEGLGKGSVFGVELPLRISSNDLNGMQTEEITSF